MGSFIDFLPLFNESEETVRARVDASVNAGLLPDDDDYVDTRQGQFYQIVTGGFVMEQARMYDEASTRMAAGFPLYAWGDYLDYHAATFNLLRKSAVAASGTVTFNAPNGTVIPAGIKVAPAQTDPSVATPSFSVTTGGTVVSLNTIDLAVSADLAGSDGNVAAAAITQILPPGVSGVTSITNAAVLSGGTDIESDSDLRDRILLAFSGQGPGNIGDYTQWALAYPGVGRVTVQPIWAGPSTVRVVVMATDGTPVAGGVVTGLQAILDPVPGLGHGKAPIGATVTVTTTQIQSVAVTAVVTHESGYTLDGTGGTIATRAAITAALKRYIDNLDVGVNVIKDHVLAQFFTVVGVHDVSLTLPAADVTISGATTPPTVARTGVVTLT